MKRTLFGICAFALISCTFAQPINKKIAAAIDEIMTDATGKHQPGTFMFRNTNILAMTTSEIHAGMDVLVDNGVIREIGNQLDLPANAITIDGTEKYLMPGLTDMHVHMFDVFHTQNTWLLLFVINGVTTVRDMDGRPEKIELRKKIANNEILGPSLFQAGQIINGKEAPTIAYAETTEQGRQWVREHKQIGYDFIKVYDHLSEEVYEAIIDEADQLQIPVTGHVPDDVTIEQALNHQHSIEHLTGYIEWNGPELFLNAEPDYPERTAASTTWICPTLSTHMTNWSMDVINTIRFDKEIIRYLPPSYQKKRTSILNKNVADKTEVVEKYGPANMRLINEIFMNLHRAGAGIVSGTDCGSIFIVPGFSIHRELRLMAKAGMAEYEVLKTSTINAARALGKEDEFGTVEVGKRADLLLLGKNPLESIDHLRTPEGVMLRGIWIPKEDLDDISGRIMRVFNN